MNFLEEIITEENIGDGLITRFPPEPNGYLHIGHAKSIVLNFGLAEKFGGKTNLRFDDTNPTTEDLTYVNSIKEDITWLGFKWNKETYTSDYFDHLFRFALKLIFDGLAYVDDSSAEEIAVMKGTPTNAGIDSPYRNRKISENLDLFFRMKNGEFADGEKTLRARIDMASPNMLMRDPLLYRIKRIKHYRTGNRWCIYPMYDFAHGQSDSIERITHSICTLEFESHRPLYDWFIEKLDIYPSTQYEFARLNMNYTIMSKRKLLELVNEKHVSGWDDPRMPTISGLRRRGYTSDSIRKFCDLVGVARRENIIDVSLLEFCIREELNKTATRRMVVVNPLKLIIDNYEDGKTEYLPSENNPELEGSGERNIPFGRELWIERDDFMEEPIKGFFRLAVGLNVRLKSAYIVKCESFKKDDNGNVTEIHCTYYPDSKSGNDVSGIKAKGTIHFVSAEHAIPVQVNLYDRLFNVEEPEGLADINPDSLKIVENAFAEADIKNSKLGDKFQFIRLGYFCVDDINSTREKLVFNRTVTLKDSWSKDKK